MDNFENLTDAELDELLLKKVTTGSPQSSPQDNYDNLSDEELENALLQKFSPEKTNQENLSQSGQAFLESMGNTISLGYLPQIQAAVESILPNPSTEVDDQLRSQGFSVSQDSYVKNRDENLQRQQLQQEKNPVAVGLGTLAGAVMSAPAITSAGGALRLGRTVTLAGRFKDSAITGAALGAISNPGDVEGEISPIQLGDRTKQAAMGGAFGLAGQAGGEVLAKGGQILRSAPQKLDKASKELAYRAIGPFKKNLKTARGQNTADKVGETLLENNIVKAGDTFEDIVEKASKLKDETGTKISSLYDEAESALSQTASSNYQKKIIEKSAPNGIGISNGAKKKIMASMKNDTAATFSGAAKSSIDKLEATGSNITLKDLREIKTNLDRDIKYATLTKEASDQQKQLKIIRDEVSSAIDRRMSAAEKVLGKESNLLKELKLENKKYGHLKTAEDVAQERIDANTANQFFSLTDKLLAGASTAGSLATSDSPEDMVKSGLWGVATAIASKNARRYGAPVASRVAKRLGSSLQVPANFAKFGKPLIEAARVSPTEFQAVLAQFSNDPEFIKLSEPQKSNLYLDRELAGGKNGKN